ncbi:hypothetical protein JGS39_20925 [Streptomyces sp. P01-B04]|uniref:hypothetical protein n=1 Tax=Streptomyces poriferorum TaxID=2798799 RepID=UPI001C5D2640|nr:hypothetical protein [Streptomyces poriferorum]MBW5251428.1 hypothetical protein [Streptomyces poriferorum]MBW5258781.1 hypothetical protein [Streptomyces poriferorum]
MVGALDASVLLFVVENHLVAQGADRLGEMLGDLVGVGPVGGQQPCREAERGKLGQGVDRIRADALARGVQDKAERQLRVAADALTGLRVTSAMSSAGSDQKTGGVSEDSFLSAPAVVPAGGELDGCEAPPTRALDVRIFPGGSDSSRLFGRQAAAPVAAMRVEDCGQPVEGTGLSGACCVAAPWLTRSSPPRDSSVSRVIVR